MYIAHGHGDHWFGLGSVFGPFPNARAFALPAVIEQMRVGSTPEFLKAFWTPRLNGKPPSELVFAESLEDRAIDLEGRELAVVELGHTDADQTSCLRAPDIGLVVAGDAAYNDVHLYLAESDPQGRRDWLAALDTIESLHPRSVIAGRQRAGRHDGPELIEETRQYIRDFDQIAHTTTTARDLYDQVLALYPRRPHHEPLPPRRASARPGPVSARRRSPASQRAQRSHPAPIADPASVQTLRYALIAALHKAFRIPGVRMSSRSDNTPAIRAPRMRTRP